MTSETVFTPLAIDAAGRRARDRRELFSYAWILAQGVVILWLARRFKLENELFQIVMAVSIAGFAVHHWLPQRFRLPFFSTLSVGTIVYCLGLHEGAWSPTQAAERGAWLAVFSAVLIGIAHLPIRFPWRVAALACAGAGMAVLRSGASLAQAFDPIWPVFGALFMFRILIYNYDLETEKTRPSFWQTTSYFFTFPNLWLYVSPILDFKTYKNCHYRTNAFEIYQKGIVWMVRGVFHLLLWRIVYYQVYVDPARVTDGTELAQYILGNVALYLRLSGQFHIMTGMLRLFGFDLPETHRHYFLATSFIDYWRRVNITWKDFMLKIFYYPSVLRLSRKVSMAWSVALATAVVFAMTFVLHPYQFFWIRGEFPLRLVDATFWATFGLLVILGGLRELRKPRQNRLGAQEVGWPRALRRARNAAFTFLTITLLWSVWSADSLSQWFDLWRTANWDTLAWLASAWGAIFLGSLWFEGPAGAWLWKRLERAIPAAGQVGWRRAAACCVLPAALMVGLTSSRVTGRLLTVEQQAIVESVFDTKPNRSDEEFMVRGYYEDLADTSRFRTLINDGFRNQPATWRQLEQTEAIRPSGDLRSEELTPSHEIVLNGKRIRTNRWGMRDDEVEPARTPGTARVAVLGASHEMGLGVDQGESFSDLLEAELNRDGGPRVEILNFAVNHYSPIAQVEVMKKKVAMFRPDAILLFGHREDVGVTMRLFGQALRQGVQPEYPYLAELAARAGIDAKTPRSIAERKLAAYWPEMIEWAYREIAADCARLGIRPIWVLQQGVTDTGESADAARMEAWARAAGFETWRLNNVFAGRNPAELIVAPWDTHPNAEGHRLIARALLYAMRQSEAFRKAVTFPQQAKAVDSK